MTPYPQKASPVRNRRQLTSLVSEVASRWTDEPLPPRPLSAVRGSISVPPRGPLVSFESSIERDFLMFCRTSHRVTAVYGRARPTLPRPRSADWTSDVGYRCWIAEATMRRSAHYPGQGRRSTFRRWMRRRSPKPSAGATSSRAWKPQVGSTARPWRPRPPSSAPASGNSIATAKASEIPAR